MTSRNQVRRPSPWGPVLTEVPDVCQLCGETLRLENWLEDCPMCGHKRFSQSLDSGDPPHTRSAGEAPFGSGVCERSSSRVCGG
jgi:hypothetical protein